MDNSRERLAEAAQLQIDGRFALSRPLYEDLLAQAPGQSTLHALYGQQLFQMGEDGEALRHLETALHLNPDDRGVLWQAGEVNLKLGDARGAADLFRQIAVIEGEAVRANLSLSDALAAQGDSAGAGQATQRALAQFTPRDFRQLLCRTHLHLSPGQQLPQTFLVAFEQALGRGNYGLAELMAQAVCRLFGPSAWGSYLMAVTANSVGAVSQAANHLAEARQRLAGCPDTALAPCIDGLECF